MAKSARGWLVYITALIALIALFVWVFYFVKTAGFLRVLSPRGYEDCERLQGFDGPEDIAIDYETGLAYVTKADRYAALQEGRSPAGDIQRLNLKADYPKPESLSPLPSETFFPHGLDLWVAADGTKRLFVVNHGRSGNDHSIEIFDISGDGGLLHARTVRSDLFVDPNDVVALGPESFYVTNLYGSGSAFGRMLETYAMLGRATVVYYDGKKAHTVLDGLQMANGIAATNDKSTVFVAEIIGRKVSAYHRNKDRGELKKQWDLSLPMGVDNLTLGPEGYLWAAGHPKLLSISARMRAKQRLSPSEVIRIDWKGRKKPAWQSIYQDRGIGITASSVAARYGDSLYIGAVFGPHMLRCHLASNEAEEPAP